MKERQTRAHNEEPSAEAKPFHGFKLPTSSTTYTPNQFFDVVLPRASRGCLRLVAYLIRKTLGWSDAQGNPQNPHAHVTYRELIENAGISRGAIKDAIDEAIDKRFIDCLRFGQPHRSGEEGYSALYSLRWDEREEYVTSQEEFNGFFAGNGNLTHIPNQFFDELIPKEPLAVVRVVGVIIRHTIGFQTKFGFRRQHVDMSFSEIMRRTGIASSSTVSAALKTAVESNYIRKVSEGFFDPCAGMTSKATTFSVRWEDSDGFEPDNEIGSKIEAEDRFKNRSGKTETVQKSKREISPVIEAGDGPEIEAVTVQESKRQAFKNRSDIETTNLNNKSKQQQTDVVERGISLSLLSDRLVTEGIDRAMAATLVQRYPAEQIQRQLDALPTRKIRSSRTGFLIRAIENDIPIDVALSSSAAGQALADHFYAELGGNQDSPVAIASPNDAVAASILLERLPAHWKSDPGRAGREFARFIQKRQEGAKSPIRSFQLAQRAFADEFLRRCVENAEREEKEIRAKLKISHEERFKDAYGAYRLAIAYAIEDEGGAEWTAFQVWLDQKMARRKHMSTVLYQHCLKQLESREGRAEMLLSYLEESDPDRVLTFWGWDATMNETPLSMDGIRA